MMSNIAMVLSGCGYLDGSEIQETVFAMLSLEQRGVAVQCFAPEGNQTRVVDHQTGDELSARRSMIQEAARICRGKIKTLAALDPSKWDGLVIPGGFGVALNLSDFALKGDATQVDPALAELIIAFHGQKKPIGAICIAPAVIARVLGKYGVQLTLGEPSEAATILESWGARYQACDREGVVVDSDHKIVSTPAYMYDDSSPARVFTGIAKLIDELLTML